MIRTKIWLCVFLACASVLPGCDRSTPPPVAVGDRYVVGGEFDEVYPLGAGDKVRIAIFSEPQLGGEYSVSGDGALSLPLVGDLSVSGKTTADVAKLVQAKLADGYLRNPKVSVEVLSYRPFFILGEVNAPGPYPYANGLTVMNAIATAHGLTTRARKKTVMIRTNGDDAEKEYVLSPDLRVRPGDTIRLTERYF